MLKTIALRSQIKNINYPACKYFETFIKIVDDKQYAKFGVCLIFGEKNIINGKITHNLAVDCRNNEKLCTPSGLYFKPK